VVIEFRVDTGSGVAPYLQLVRQVERAVRLGLLRPGDRLPTVKEVASGIAINPNTVLKAYRELDHRGVTVGRVGQGTFIRPDLTTVPVAAQVSLARLLERWLREAIAAGLVDEDIEALVVEGMRRIRAEGVA
jgi:DNA-binding transcriptional regulator YhcF (GntR family)